MMGLRVVFYLKCDFLDRAFCVLTNDRVPRKKVGNVSRGGALWTSFWFTSDVYLSEGHDM